MTGEGKLGRCIVTKIMCIMIHREGLAICIYVALEMGDAREVTGGGNITNCSRY